MFSPLLHSLSNSICNLRLQATWNRNVSDTQHSETAVFPSTSGWYNSMSKTPVSLGDDEPFGTSPGSSNCSSKQRFQRSTSVKKGTRALQRSPGLWIVFLPDPADPERTFRAPVLTISLYYFHPCFDNSATVALPRWQYGYKESVLDLTIGFTLLCLELLQPARDKAMNISGSYITSSGESANGNKRNGLLEKLRYNERLACLRSIGHKVILTHHPIYLLILGFLMYF